ncbi:MAG: hypothetical protein GXP16_13555 [Gammaproteobacteria bacterium]|nr:hypothetical protein [Gammaproteobacteria bacterium]
MRLADYVVSYSLHINNRCLRYLAECDMGGASAAGMMDCSETNSSTVFTESLLARDTRRLLSMWSLIQPALPAESDLIHGHIRALKTALATLAEEPQGQRLALRIASIAAQDSEANALVSVARHFQTPKEVNLELTWDDLNELFTQDSAAWRRSTGFKQIEDELLARRVTRSYRKGLRLAETLAPAQSGSVDAWLSVNATKFQKWVQHITHQLELLRPGLSEKGKAQLWYLGKLADTLRMRSGLLDLEQATQQAHLKKGTLKIASKCINGQIAKMDNRVVRLIEGCFKIKHKRFDNLVVQAIKALGVGGVVFALSATSSKATTNSKALSNAKSMTNTAPSDFKVHDNR